MKKSIIALLLVVCMAVLFVGCKKDDATNQQATNSPATQDQTQYYYNVTFNAMTYNGITYEMILEVEDDSNMVDKRTNTISFTTQKGTKMSDVLAQQGYVNLVVDESFDEFLGWMEYKIIPTVNEEGYNVATYEKLSADTYYTTEQLLEKQAPDFSVVYVAKWKSIEDSYYQAFGY